MPADAPTFGVSSATILGAPRVRNISLCPWKVGDVVAAALVILHTDHQQAT
ncbi:hypothetical protein [Salinispora mooreana]|uniref:hypothetical protein n=1 Tax=Salinispora mooreana TaxID=999545 RepID=UPI000370E6B3|nr:hypothetical protein [Salinispora mooreana]